MHRTVLTTLFAIACSGGADDTTIIDTDTDDTDDTDSESVWVDHSLESNKTFNDLHVVGGKVFAASTGTQVCHFDGSEWIVPGATGVQPCWDRVLGLDSLPNLGGTGTIVLDEGAAFNGIWADPSSSRLVVVGDAGYILEFDGTGWIGVHDVGTINFESVDGPAPGNLLAVSWGAIYDNADGDWTDPTVLNNNPRFNDVWFDGTFAITVGEEGYIGFFGGASWTLEQDAQTRKLYGVDALSSTDAWAVGEQGAALHFDGTTWTAKDVPTASSLWGVTMLSSDEVVAVGANGVAFRWDGSNWQNLPTGTNKNLLAVTADNDGTIWACGNRGGLFKLAN